MRVLRVLMVTDFYWPYVGGVEQHVRTVAHELVRRGHTVAVATLSIPGEPAEYDDGGVQVFRVRSTTQRLPSLFDQVRPWAPPVPDPAAVRALRRIVGRFQPDVVHGHDWLARSAMVDRRVPVVSSQHYYTLTCAKKNLLRDGAQCGGPNWRTCVPCAGEHYGRVKGAVTVAGAVAGRSLERRVVRRFISVSSATAVGNGLETNSATSVVVPNCLGPSIEAPDPELLAQLPAEPYFLYVGDFRAVKGIDVLLDAYALLGTQRPLVLIGKTWPESPQSVPAGVVRLDAWPNGSVRAAMAGAHAVVVPSVWAEPFGIVAIEAMAVGSPVVASRTGGLVDIVRDRVDGLLVEPGSVGQLRDALAELDANAALRDQLANAAAAASGRYAAQPVVDQIERVYFDAIDEHFRTGRRGHRA